MDQNVLKSLQGEVDKAADKTQANIGSIKSAANSSANWVSNKVEGARSKSESALDDASEMTGDLANRATKLVQDASQGVRDRATNIQEQTVGYVKEEPVKAILIAAAVGLFLGVLLRS